MLSCQKFLFPLIYNVMETGQSGMAGGMETLCGQAYGARQYQRVGDYTYCLRSNQCPVNLHGQAPDSYWLRSFHFHPSSQVLGLAYPWTVWGAILKPIVRYLQPSSLILLLMISSFIVLCFHIPICWILIFKLELGGIGAAVSFCLFN